MREAIYIQRARFKAHKLLESTLSVFEYFDDTFQPIFNFADHDLCFFNRIEYYTPLFNFVDYSRGGAEDCSGKKPRANSRRSHENPKNAQIFKLLLTKEYLFGIVLTDGIMYTKQQGGNYGKTQMYDVHT